MRSQNDKVLGHNAYLLMAQRAIRHARRPLSPIEILEIATHENFVPEHLFGATMHKTLAARLAVHIRTHSSGSIFFRTAPATFFLHELARLNATDPEFKKVYVGNLRAKSIRKENVLVVPKDVLSSNIYGQYVPFDNDKFNQLFASYCTFMDRSQAEENDEVKQFVTFTLVLHDRKILIYRRGKFTTTSERLKGQLSVGFGGHVNDTDFNLFHRGQDAFLANAARELREELFLDEYYHDQEDCVKRTNILGYINVDDDPDAQHHIAVLVALRHLSPDLPKKGELSINQLSWLDLNCPPNDLSDFDLWSGMILENIIQGKIRLENRA